jgi:mono/diheme cytochrome c family protein
MADSLNNGPSTPQPPSARPARTDRAVKVGLLVASAVTLAFLVAAMIRENFASPWRHYQREYRELLRNSPDKNQRRLGESFEVHLRQVDLPQLGTTDRCVSCHVGIDNPAMANQKQPFRAHSGDFLKHHPVENYGCTSCHRGQGAATNFHEAKATDVFWDYPLLPARLTEASCGACHSADSPLMAKHAPKLARGRQLFLDRGCQSCHKLGGVGGQLGPALDGEGMKIKHQLPMAHVKGEHTLANWLTQHFERPQGIVADSQMRPPRLTPAENEALTIYMLSLQNRDLPQTYVAPDRVAAWDRDLHEKIKDPAVLYNRYCVNCHGNGTYGQWDKFYNRFMPAIRGPGLRAIADKTFLSKAIEQGRPGTLMPVWGKGAGGLTPKQVDLLVDYLARGEDRTPPASHRGSWADGLIDYLAGRSGRPKQKLRPIPDRLNTGKAVRGNALFTQLCIGCHGAGRVAPSLGNPVFQKTASPTFLAKTIVNGRTDTAMPAFQGKGAAGLTDQEIRDLVAYIQSLGKKH